MCYRPLLSELSSPLACVENKKGGRSSPSAKMREVETASKALNGMLNGDVGLPHGRSMGFAAGAPKSVIAASYHRYQHNPSTWGDGVIV